MKRCFVGGYTEKSNVEAVLHLMSCSEFKEEVREKDDPFTICVHCVIKNLKGYCKLTRNLPLVDPEALKRTVKDAEEALKLLRSKGKKTNKDLLSIEYLRTFVNNPTPVNYILMSCGRTDEMKRKEEKTSERPKKNKSVQV